MDFMLSKDDSACLSMSNQQPIELHFNNKNTIIANTSWSGATSSTDILKNIGYTAVDNGFINYDRDRIANDEFLEIFTNSTLDLSVYNDKFYVNKVSGNTQLFTYPIEQTEDFVSLKGGFYQGFFKVDGSNYQTLPHQINNEWYFDITLRPMNYDIITNTLNGKHPENQGMFFYIGTRAENKFWELYKKEGDLEYLREDTSSDYIEDFEYVDSAVINHQYHEDTPHPEYRDENYGNPNTGEQYFIDDFNPYDDYDDVTYASMYEKGDNYIIDYFEDDYTGIGTTCDCPENDMAIDDDYIMDQIALENIQLKDTKGFAINEMGFYEIATDNKFIIFNQTNTGHTTETWQEGFDYIITGKTNHPNINYYPYLNHTETGFTKDNMNKLIEEYEYSYNVFGDITENAFGLKINQDGSITYRYIITDCESEYGFALKEETTKPNLIKQNEWSKIAVRFIKISNVKMKVYIYVNGALKLVSTELPLLNLRRLDDLSTRQECVPYSISIGGGTQGLSERIILDYYDITDYQLPLEKYFGGSFIGDIQSFNFYDGYFRDKHDF
jgi:hypothetical protein